MSNVSDPDLSAVATSTLPPNQSVSLWQLFSVWLMLGMQSFGGGTATLFLIRRTIVEQHKWLTPEEFTRDWSICFVAPGINLLCITILIGRRVGGAAGAVISLVGLLLPSVSITIAMTALYAQIKQLPELQAALHGIIPATVGLGLLLGADMARPLLKSSWLEGRLSLVVSLALLLGSLLLTAFFQPPVIVLLCASGLICALFAWWLAKRKSGQQ